jgi:hypothetical protein
VRPSPTKIIIDDPQDTGWEDRLGRPPHGHLFRCDPLVRRANPATAMVDEEGLPTFYCGSRSEILTTTRALLAGWAARNGEPAYCRVTVSLHRIH